VWGKYQQNKQRKEALKADKKCKHKQKGRIQVRIDERTGSRISVLIYWSEVLLRDPAGTHMHRTIRNAETVGNSGRGGGGETCRYAVFKIITCIAAAMMWQAQTIPICVIWIGELMSTDSWHRVTTALSRNFTYSLAIELTTWDRRVMGKSPWPYYHIWNPHVAFRDMKPTYSNIRLWKYQMLKIWF